MKGRSIQEPITKYGTLDKSKRRETLMTLIAFILGCWRVRLFSLMMNATLLNLYMVV